MRNALAGIFAANFQMVSSLTSKVLRSRLFDMKTKEQEAKLAQLGGEKRDIAFGSQIRNYVLQPYQQVKDDRTGHEEGNVAAVLDGALDPFMESWLRWQRAGLN